MEVSSQIVIGYFFIPSSEASVVEMQNTQYKQGIVMSVSTYNLTVKFRQNSILFPLQMCQHGSLSRIK